MTDQLLNNLIELESIIFDNLTSFTRRFIVGNNAPDVEIINIYFNSCSCKVNFLTSCGKCLTDNIDLDKVFRWIDQNNYTYRGVK